MESQITKAIVDALSIIGGGRGLSYYIAGFFFASLGILISLYYSSTKRNIDSQSTPRNFSWRFLLWDNTKRGVTTLVVMFILFRVFDLSAIPLMIGVGICVSIAFDRILVFLMGWSEGIFNLLASQRKKFQ